MSTGSCPSRSVDGVDDAQLDDVAAALKSAERILWITGAGLSADSGLPTYRGVGGLYDTATPEEGQPIETILSGEMLAANPALTWKYLLVVARATAGSSFNRGHEIIAAFDDRVTTNCVLTQNVDGYHSAAGARDVIEIHGNLHHLSCTRCSWRGDAIDHADPRREVDVPVRCPACGATARPDVVLFGEALPIAALERFEQTMGSGLDLVLSVGTSSLFPYIAAPIMHARQIGVMAVEINPTLTPVSDQVDVRLPGGAAAVLSALWARVTEGASS